MKAIFMIAVAGGMFFSYVDHRPNFEDVWVLAFGIAAVSAILSFIEPHYRWLWAAAVGVWMPLVNIMMGGGIASLTPLVFAFAGAILGSSLRTSLPRST